MILRVLLITSPLFILCALVFVPSLLLISLFEKDGGWQHWLAKRWSRAALWVSGVRVVVEGAEHIDPKQNYILASNHRSLLDTPVVVGKIPIGFRFVAKQSLFDLPVWGIHMRRAGHLSVVRDDPRGAIRAMNEASHIIRERKISVILFPEGTRGTGELQEFKEGAAYLAIKAGIPVLPIGITGTGDLLKPGSWHIYPGTVTLRIGAPIPTADLPIKERSALTQLMHERVAALIG